MGVQSAKMRKRAAGEPEVHATAKRLALDDLRSWWLPRGPLLFHPSLPDTNTKSDRSKTLAEHPGKTLQCTSSVWAGSALEPLPAGALRDWRVQTRLPEYSVLAAIRWRWRDPAQDETPSFSEHEIRRDVRVDMLLRRNTILFSCSKSGECSLLLWAPTGDAPSQLNGKEAWNAPPAAATCEVLWRDARRADRVNPRLPGLAVERKQAALAERAEYQAWRAESVGTMLRAVLDLPTLVDCMPLVPSQLLEADYESYEIEQPCDADADVRADAYVLNEYLCDPHDQTWCARNGKFLAAFYLCPGCDDYFYGDQFVDKLVATPEAVELDDKSAVPNLARKNEALCLVLKSRRESLLRRTAEWLPALAERVMPLEGLCPGCFDLANRSLLAIPRSLGPLRTAVFDTWEHRATVDGGSHCTLVARFVSWRVFAQHVADVAFPGLSVAVLAVPEHSSKEIETISASAAQAGAVGSSSPIWDDRVHFLAVIAQYASISPLLRAIDDLDMKQQLSSRT